MLAAADPLVALGAHYQRVVDSKFDGVVPRDYRIVWNPRLRRITGRIRYDRMVIELSGWHFARYGMGEAVATLEHELLHLYLHRLGHPGGHGPAFKRLAAAKGIRVFHENPYPKNRTGPFRVLYDCPGCARIVVRARRIDPRRPIACGRCCRAETGGRWDARFALRLIGKVQMV